MPTFVISKPLIKKSFNYILLMKNVILGLLFILLAQMGGWFQQFAQMKWLWFKEHQWVSVFLLGVPTSYFFIWGAQYLYSEVASVWSVRLFQFSIGMGVVFGLTYYVMNEPLTLKNGVCLALATVIVLIQTFWK
jgi:hypothetical protein